jgi:serine/threonine protein kinase
LGEGSFGKVVEGIDILTSQLVAIKKINKKGHNAGQLEFYRSENIIGQLLNEEYSKEIVR